MLIALNKIREIQKSLEIQISEKKIKDYRIALQLDMEIIIHVLVDKKNILDNPYKNSINKISYIEVTESEKKHDSYYQFLFDNIQNPNKIDVSARRRFPNILDLNIELVKTPCPVITFYSYKGGVGRSTTLASFAAHYAMKQGKKVMILDCDLEAPGFTNFYDLNIEKRQRSNGLVEYLLDKEFGEKPDLQDYIIEVGKEYCGDGNIFIMPAGNLSETLTNTDDELSRFHIEHYLEGLGRLDINSSGNIQSSGNIINQFSSLINDIYASSYRPDVILIDSRTGFNDIFGILAFHFSKIVVGFFGDNIQTSPGLFFFLDSLSQVSSKPYIVVANSIISSSRYFKDFEKDVNNLVERFEDIPAITIRPIERIPKLETLGTRGEYKPDFINLINYGQFPDYEAIFKDISNFLEQIKEKELENEKLFHFLDDNNGNYANNIDDHFFDEIIDESQQIEKENLIDIATNDERKLTKQKLFSFKRKILENLKSELPKLLYGESITNVQIDEDFLKNRFYFRKCMEDIFNKDKFLIMGGKGTGKTYFYNALRNKIFIKKLAERANKSLDDYTFVPLISLKNEENKDKLLLTSTVFKDDLSQVINPDYIFKRFWVLYMWNAIMIELQKQEYNHIGFKSNLNIKPIENDIETKERFLSFINNDDMFRDIEDELKELDKHLKNTQKNIIILIEQLDYIVKPIYWKIAVSPLIEYWRFNSFSRIIPKIFVRRDLTEKWQMTNKQEVINNAMSLEWSREELFSYFFKILLSFSKSKAEFFQFLNTEFDKGIVYEIKEISKKDNQIPANEQYLRPMVEAFFGKWADRESKHQTYEWFYKNLKNANETISLRPFIDLLSEAVKFAYNSEDRTPSPILSYFYFAHKEARKFAVIRHIDELTSEKGNEDLKKTIDYIRERMPVNQKVSFMNKSVFEGMLKDVVKYYSEISDNLQNNNILDLKNLLIINGIVSETRNSGYASYSFALLYKYYLGLSSKRFFNQSKNILTS